MGGGRGTAGASATTIASTISPGEVASGSDTHHVLELFAMPAGAARLPENERFKLVRCASTSAVHALVPCRVSLSA